MKTKKNFLKKLTAGILGFVMTLGVGAAGYAASATETHASAKWVQITSLSDIVSGQKYAIVNADYYLPARQFSAKNSGGTSFNSSDTTQTDILWTFTGTTSAMKITVNGDTSKTLYLTNDNNGVVCGNQPSKTWSITKNSSANTFQFLSNDGTQDRYLTYASGNFRCYKTSGSSGDKYSKIYRYDNGGAATYTLSFNANGGSGTMGQLTEQSTIQSSPACSFTAPSGKTFNYWSTSSSGSAATFPLTLTANTTLYAIWKNDDPNFSITHTNFTEITTSYTTTFTHNYTWNSKTIPVEAYGVYKNSNGIQMNKSKGTYIKNTQALGVKITKIVCTWTASGANSPTLYVSENAVASKSSTSLGKGSSSVTTQTYNVTDSTKNYQYFYFDGTTVTGACYLSELKIYYAPIVVHTITVSGSSEVYVGKTITLTASCDQGDSITQWTSSNTNVATVSDGVVTGKAAGSVTITAKGSCNATGTKTITVKADVKTLESITVSGSKKTTFYPGDKFAFGGTVTGTYSHSNGDPNSTETISSGYTFKIDGVSATVGSTSMTEGTHTVVVSYGGKDATGYQITVAYDDPESITVTSESTMGPGDELELTPSVNPSTANQAVDYDYDVEGDLVDETDFIFMDGSLVIDEGNVNFGTITITVSSHVDPSVYATCVVTVLGVKAPEIVGVDYNITGSYKAEQYVNKQPIDLTGIEFYVIYDNEDTATISASEIEWDDELEVGDNPYGIYVDPVTGNDFDITIEEIIIIADSLKSISINTPAALTKSSYVVGEQWSSAGLSVSGLMNSGDAAASSLLSDVTYTFSPSEPSVGLTSVNVTAHVGTLNSTAVSVTVSVAAQTLTSISLDTLPTKRSYNLGENLDLTDMVLTAHYNLSLLDHPMTSSEYTVEGYDKFTVSQSQTVTLKSTVNPNFTQTFTVEVHAQSTADSYDKVKSAPSSWEGTYLIAYLDGSTAKVFNGVDGPSDHVDDTSAGDKVDFAEGMARVKITSMTGGYSLQLLNGTNKDKYLGGTSGSNTIGFNASATLNTLEFQSDDSTVKITSNTSVLRFNSATGTSNDRFRYYKSTTSGNDYHLPTLYKETAGTAASLIRITAVCNKTGIIPVGTTLQLSDFTVSGLYSDGTTKTLQTSEYSATGLTLSNVGDNVVTISATGVDSCQVHVTAVEATYYDLVLMDGGSQYGETISAIKGQTVNLPTLEKAGSTFNGWSDGSSSYTSTYTMPEHDVTLNASWIVNHYSVTYNANGGTGTAPTDSNSYVYDDEVTVLGSNGLTKDYCTFGGWSDGTSTYDEDDTFKITSDVSLSAVWTNNKVTVEYDKNGGGGTKPTTDYNINQGSSYTVKDATPTMITDENRPFGTHFAGWNTKADGSGTSYAAGTTINPIMENLKLYAQWKVDDVPVGGGEGSINFKTLYGESNHDVESSYSIKDSNDSTKEVCSLSFSSGGTATKYYSNGYAMRIYSGSSFEINSSVGKIIGISITFGTSDGSNTITANVGTYSNGSWTGSSDSVTFSIGGTSGNRRIQAITVTLAGGRSMPSDYTIAENLSGLGGDAPINVGGGITAENLGKYGEITKTKPVEFKAPLGKVITYADIFLLYDAGYSVLYSNDYGESYDYNPFDTKTRATRADEPSNPDLKETNAVKFTLNEADKDIIKGFKVTAAFATNSDMSVDYDWEKAGNNYTIDITKACVRFSIDVDESFAQYIGNERYKVGFAISKNGHVVDATGSIISSASIQYYSKDYMPANNEFGLKVNTKLQLNETYYVVLFVYDTVNEEYIEISKEKAASFKDVFDAYFTEEVVSGLNAEEKAVYDKLYSMLYPSAQ